MEDNVFCTRDPDLIRKYIKEGYKVVSIGYFPNNENPSYNFTFRKKTSKKKS